MLLINCPYCGPRPEVEFTNGRDAHKPRPTNVTLENGEEVELSDAQWAEYVFMQDAKRGWYAERWCHAAGCRRWFNAVRNTVTNEIAATYAQGAPQPPLPDAPNPNPTKSKAKETSA